MRELIYVGGPFTEDSNEKIMANVCTAMGAALEIYKKGHIPVIPHLMYWLDQYAKNHGVHLDYDDYMTIVDAQRERCDSMLRIAPSPGTNIEEGKSWDEGKRLYYSLDEIKPYGVADSIKQGLNEAIDYTLNKCLD